MKNVNQNRTFLGRSGESYVGRLFMMAKIRDGSRNPDLIAVRDEFNPKLSLEVKSGGEGKSVVNEFQFHYPLTVQRNYMTAKGRLTEVIMYYNILQRTDALSMKELSKPYSAIKLRYGNQYIVPHQLIFHLYAISRSIRSGEPIDEVLATLGEVAKKDFTGKTDWKKLKEDRMSWQNVYPQDMIALFNRCLESGAKKEVRERLSLLHEIYPNLDNLCNVEIDGPNGTKIFVLLLPEHHHVFDNNLRQVVGERMPTIEEVTRERQEAEGLLGRISEYYQADLLDEKRVEKSFFTINLGNTEIKFLERLVKWMAEGEKPFTITS